MNFLFSYTLLMYIYTKIIKFFVCKQLIKNKDSHIMPILITQVWAISYFHNQWLQFDLAILVSTIKEHGNKNIASSTFNINMLMTTI
jgi:hypothetical protein